jgi:hypothetical protein
MYIIIPIVKRPPLYQFLILLLTGMLLLAGAFAAGPGAAGFAHLAHDCTGDDCPVCLWITAAQNAVQQLAMAARVFAAAGLCCAAAVPLFLFPSPSAITLKVRLNN